MILLKDVLTQLDTTRELIVKYQEQKAVENMTAERAANKEDEGFKQLQLDSTALAKATIYHGEVKIWQHAAVIPLHGTIRYLYFNEDGIGCVTPTGIAQPMELSKEDLSEINKIISYCLGKLKK